jgi:glycosyltransferase involved in cell wall biosynthesis
LVRLSLVIPCFNEGENLPLLLKRCSQFMCREDIEIVIVNNGSTDNSTEILNNLLPNYSFVSLVHVEKNLGYGHGVLEGLRNASGDILAWTHADMQTDPCDVIKAMGFYKNTSTPERLFIKGSRYGRPFADVFFTFCMSLFETILLRTPLWDINAQPNVFHRSFYETWTEPPTDFSLDLYVYFMARKRSLRLKRFPVSFEKRTHGVSSWNVSPLEKYRFIKRTLYYSFALARKVRNDA